MSEEYTVERLLHEAGFLVHAVKGVSMMPLLDQNKDAVHLVPIEGALKKNDIVLFRRADSTLVLHRIIKVRKDGYLIRGDSCMGSELVRRENIIAIADAIYKDGQYIPCDDKKLIRYAKKQPVAWFFRYVRSSAATIYRRVFKKTKKEGAEHPLN